MANTTYDELLRQVESLRAENTHLKRELQDNSSHLTLLEGEATNMKDVLTNLQTSMDVENPDSSMSDVTSCYPEFQTPPPRKVPRDDNDKDLDQNSNSSSNDETSSTEQTWAHLNASNPFRGSNPQLNPPKNRSDEDKSVEQLQLQAIEGGKRRRGGTAANNEELYVVLQELDQERSTLLSEIEAEDKHCKWYYEQIDAINSKINALPTAQSFNTPADVQRRQLEYDGQRLRKLLQDNLGSAEQIARRHDARLQRIRIIETEMLFMQQRQHQVDQDKRDSGTCDLLEGDEDGLIVSDASTNTLVSGDAFITNPHAESQAEHGILISGPNGTNFVTIATQTAAESADSADAVPLSAIYHGGWVLPPTVDPVAVADMLHPDTASVMSFRSSNVSSSAASQASYQQQQGHPLGTKVEMVYSLLSMLGTHDKDDMSRTLLAMSSSQDSCIAMRQSGCLPLLIQLLHGSDKDAGLLGNTRGSKAARARAAAALHNIVHSHPDDKRGRREARVLRLLEQIRAHCDQLRCMLASEEGSEGNRSRPSSADIDHHPGPAIAALMKLSFDEEHRHAICTLGGLQAIAELLQLDHETNGTTSEQYNITMRRYACMALTNLTFGDGTNKALLCSMKCCMAALVAQLQSPNEDLRQVAASVLRNLSWRADLASKKMLREVHSVTALMQASMQVKKESTLKSILSALWNLSAHCSENKADICTVDGALAFQVSILTYKSPSKTLAIIENGGGILRNVSSHIAVREDYRVVLREHGCLPILLKHLRSPSLTIVSNACGTLWNLSARCPVDQKALWEMGAVNMLRNLVHSKHKMISMGSAAALKNLLSARPALNMLEDNVFPKPNMPGLHARKAKALKEELECQHLSETCENLESPQGSPTEGSKRQKNRFFADDYSDPRAIHGQLSMHGEMQSKKPRESPVSRSSSQDSIRSSQSGHSMDSPRMNPLLLRSKLLQERQSFDPRCPLLRGGNGAAGDGPNSRIIQAMQEVALHAGLDAENRDPYSEEARRTTGSRHKAASSIIPTFRGQPPAASVVTSAAQNLHGYSSSNPEALNNAQDHSMNFSHLSQRMENLHLNLPDPDQDEPINYSIKYSEAQVSTRSEPTVSCSSQRPNNQLSSSTGSAFTKPTAKLHNYVGGVHGYADAKSISQNSAGLKRSRRKAKTNRIQQSEQQQQFNSTSYTITDLDTDQPTNYGMRYAEEDEEEENDDEESAEEPINYSTRYTETEESSSPNDYVQEEALDDDQIRTFCTEGTPLNFMSTATSINDLTSANKQHNRAPPPFTAPKSAEILNLSTKADSELVSSTGGSHSTDRNTGSTVILKKGSSSPPPTFQGSPPEADQSASSSLPPSLYSYNDNSTHTSSPSEKARQYCTEGTPTCFSRASSLSSLNSCEADATTATSSPQTSSSRPESHLQSIDENDSLNLTNNDVTLKPHDASLPSSANTTLNSTPGNGKTVTFDDNHQVQETPLMFSRCSSLGSLSSCDAHSVHSSVVSEYSRRESEVVSPSDLPASPSEPMPNSPPSLRKSPVKFVAGPPPVMKTTDSMHALQQKPMPMKMKLFNDSPQHFADEGSPLGDFSCATSLSALTIDDDDVMIMKEASLRRIPLGQEEDEAPLCGEQINMDDTINTVIENQRHDLEVTNLEDDDDDDFSVSEGEENILAECISLAMPTKSSRKVKKSGSDSHLKSQTDDQKMPANHSMSRAPKPNVMRPQDSEPQSGYDTPIKYATEDTPHNFSTAGSLSDLSLDSHKAGDGASMPDQNDLPTIKDDVDDDASDLSSLSGGDEALLSEAIQAAMPKSKKKLVMHRTAEGADVREKQPFQGFKKPSVPPSREHERPAAYGDLADCVTTYAVEGTPINFSRRTSLSDISVDSVPVNREEPVEKVRATPSKAKGPTSYHDPATDSPRVFGMEGTPVSFSRNDSLSSLSCDEEEYAAVARGASKAKLSNPKKPDSPAVARLKTPVSKKPGPCTSTPMVRHEGASRHSDDQIKSFAVEDTPAACISRNSSLSSLNSEDHEDLKAQAEGHFEGADHDVQYEVEAAQGALSKNSSLSSLSVESLSFDDTEDALLAECINSALPKSKKKAKKEAVIMVRASPSGSSGAATHPSSREDEEDSWPKNAEGPQAEIEDTGTTPVEEEEEEEASVVKMTESEEFEEQDLCLEAKKCVEVIEQEGEEMSDSESVITLSTKEKTASVESLTMGCRPLEGMMSSDALTDIMKESFPEMSSSLVSTITTPDELPTDITMKEESTLEEAAFSKELTHSDEMLLEENANIILSELSLKMERSGSLLDEDLLNDEQIDTLSLVSNDYPSDDDDDTQSQSSKAASDEAPSLSQSVSVQHKGPRIVKPVNKEAVRQLSQDNAPKAIRGRRRPLSAPRNPVSTASAASQNKTKVVKPVLPKRSTSLSSPRGNTSIGKPRLNDSKQNSSPGAKKSPPKTATKPGATRTPLAKKESGMPSPRGSSSSLSSQISNKIATGKSPTKPTSASKSKIAVPSKLAESKRKSPAEVERPGPLIKQNTFTKETPTVNVPLITSDDKIEQEEHHSNRNSLSTEPENWSKTLEMYNFLVDSPDDAEEKSVVKKPELPKPKSETSSKLSKLKSPMSVSPAKAKTGLSKGPSANRTPNSAIKTSSSGASLHKSASGTSLTKTSSSGSLRSSGSGAARTPPRPALPPRNNSTANRGSKPSGKTDGQISPKRGSPPGKATPSRSASAGGSPANKEPPKKLPKPTLNGSAAGKKPAVSKIAGLWKKDLESESNVKKTPQVKPKPKKPTEQNKEPETLGISRSATYDKLEVGKELKLAPEPEETSADAVSSDPCTDTLSSTDSRSATSESTAPPSTYDAKKIPPPLPPRNSTWKASTLPAKLNTAPASKAAEKTKPEKPSKPAKKSLSLFKRLQGGDADKSKKEVSHGGSKSETASEIPAPPKKKGFSLWRRDGKSNKASKAAQDASSIPKYDENSENPPKVVFSNGSPLGSPTRTQAIVPPFNYKGPSSKPDEESSEQPTALGSPALKHLTKTEMLLARRRRSYLNSVHSEESADEASSGEGKKVLVTTV